MLQAKSALPRIVRESLFGPLKYNFTGLSARRGEVRNDSPNAFSSPNIKVASGPPIH